MLQTSPVVKQYYRCLEAGSPYKDGEWERMQAACSSQSPGGPPGRGRGRGQPGGPGRGSGPEAGGGTQPGSGRGGCFK